MRKGIPFLILVLLLLILPLSVSSTVRDTARNLLSPLGRTLTPAFTGGQQRLSSFNQLASLRDDRTTLQLRVIELQQKVSDLERIKRENETLRKELGVTNSVTSASKVLGRIIIHGTDPLERLIILDVGTNNGVAVGQPVVSEGVLVGRVDAVTANTADVLLLTSKRSKVQVWISESREKGLLMGDGNAISLTQLDRSAKISQKQLVETSGLGGSLPVGIPIGDISNELSKPSDSTQHFLISPLRDFSTLESVFVLTVGK